MEWILPIFFLVFWVFTIRFVIFGKDPKWMKGAPMSKTSRAAAVLIPPLFELVVISQIWAFTLVIAIAVFLLIPAFLVLFISGLVDDRRYRKTFLTRKLTKDEKKDDLITNLFFLGFMALLVAAPTRYKFLGISGWWWLGIWVTGYITFNRIQYHKRISRHQPGRVDWWLDNPPGGLAKVSDNYTGASLGTLKNDQIKFLIDKFIEYGMEDNDFYFLSEGLEMFIHTEKPDPQLEKFLKDAMNGKTEMELHWEKA